LPWPAHAHRVGTFYANDFDFPSTIALIIVVQNLSCFQHNAPASERRISSLTVWTILNIIGQTQDQNARVGKAMRELGWRRANTAGTVRIRGKNVMGYVRGKSPWTIVEAERRFNKDTGKHELLVYRVSDKSDDDKGGAAQAAQSNLKAQGKLKAAQGNLRLVQGNPEMGTPTRGTTRPTMAEIAPQGAKQAPQAKKSLRASPTG
jgi:hypothetical protein